MENHDSECNLETSIDISTFSLKLCLLNLLIKGVCLNFT